MRAEHIRSLRQPENRAPSCAEPRRHPGLDAGSIVARGAL